MCRMFAVSCISTMNVEWPRAMLSDAPTRAKMRSTSGIFASRAGHERAGLRHDAEQRRLPQIRRLAAHVRPGQDDELRCRAVERRRRSERTRSPAADVAARPPDDGRRRRHLVAVVHVRLDVVVDRGGLGQRGEHVERGERARRRLDPRRFGRDRARSASKISSSRSRMRSSAPRTFSSYSFSAGVMKRSPPAIVCLR